MRKLVGLVALGLVACASEDSTPELGSGGGTCAQRDTGSYIVKYTVRSGDCGETAETVINPGPQPTEVKAPCTGQITYSADNCEVTYSSTCPAESIQKGAELTISGKSKWTRDGALGTAVESWAVRNATGQTLCQGTYDVTVTRQ